MGQSESGVQNPPGTSPWARADICTLPNALSLCRFLLGLAFPWLQPPARGPVILVGALTDLADGLVGRWRGSCSRVGRVLDPVADKTFVAAVVLTLLAEGAMTWPELVLLAARDLVVIVGAAAGLATRSWVSSEQLTPTLLGKATTAAQFAFLVALVLLPMVRDLVFGVAAVLSLAAGAQYLGLFLRARRATGPSREEHPRIP